MYIAGVDRCFGYFNCVRWGMAAAALVSTLAISNQVCLTTTHYRETLLGRMGYTLTLIATHF